MKKFYLLTVLLSIKMLSYSQWEGLSQVSQYYPAWDVKSHDNKLFVTTNIGVYSSNDSGSTWMDLTNGFASSSSSSDREIIFTTNNEIFVRTATYGILRSLDNGISWTIDTIGIGSTGSSNEAKTIFYDNANNRVFTSAGWPSYGLYYKSPTDSSWVRINSGTIGTNSGTLIHYMCAKGGKLFAAGYNTFFESSDGGMSWSQKIANGYPSNTASAFTSAPFLAIGNDLYMGSTGLYKSSDDGNNWSRIDNNFTLFYGMPFITAIHYDGTKLYAASRSSSGTSYVYVTSDLGVNWQDLDYGASYFVSITTHNGKLYGNNFGSDSLYVYNNNGTTNISETTHENNFNVYPNPAKGFFSIYSSFSGNTVVEIFDMQGKKVMSSNILFQKNSTSTIVLPESLKGLCFIRLINEKGEVQQQKIIIE